MYEVTELISGVCTIVHGEFGMEFDTQALAYHRFITHVRFFAQRLLLGTYYQEDDGDLLDMICVKYPQAYACTQKIAAYILQLRGQNLGREEELYLTVHIARVAKHGLLKDEN